MPDIKFLAALAIASTITVAFGGSESVRDEGIAAFHSGRYSVALDKLQRAVATDSQDVKAQIFLALTQAARNNCTAALPALEKNSQNPDGQLARLAGLAAAKCDEAGERDLAAMAILNRLQQRFPSDADVLYAVAKLHMKAFNAATWRMYQRTPSSYRVHELSAEIFEIQNRFDEAVDEYQKAIALNPNAVDLHFRLGRALLLRSHSGAALEQASKAFQAELKVNPEDAACEFQLGQIAGVQNKGDEARAHFERALVLSPSFPEAMVALGKLEAQAKQYDRAISLLKRATELQPSNESAHYALMMVYRDSGQMEKAKAEKTELDRLQHPPEGEFTQFLKKLGEKPRQ